MSDDGGLYALIAEIEKSMSVLARMEDYYAEYLTHSVDDNAPTRENRIVIAEILANYYTCLETIFLRISQYFENGLSGERWHHDLLDKMTLSIEGVRPRVLSDECHAALREIMRFRHFKRYYPEFEYDWDKLQFLRRKLDIARPAVKRDLDRLLAKLRAAGE